MKKTLGAFWAISAVFLAVAALWSVVSGLSDVMAKETICGIALVIFGVVSVLAFFTSGVRATSGGWLLFDGFISFFCGLAYIFSYVDRALFNVDIIYIMGLWLMMLGVSQLARASAIGRSFGKAIMNITAGLGVLSGLSLYVRPVSDLLLISEAMKLCGYTLTFLLIIAALMVISRCFACGRK